MAKSIHVRVPGTSANCGPGFDCLGLACSIYNDLTLTLTHEPGLRIDIAGDGARIIPRDERNIVWRSVRYLLDQAGNTEWQGGHLEMVNHIPLSRGLGSSAAAIVAGLKAANAWLDSPFNRHQLLQFATAIEGHPDNVAPALFGGFTASITQGEKVECFTFLPRYRMRYVVAVPDFPLSTRKAREVLPEAVTRADAVYNIGRASVLVGALCRGSERFLQYALDDKLHQPYRASLIPGMYETFAAAKEAGAYGASLSGAGPCLIAFVPEKKHCAQDVARAMREKLRDFGIKARVLGTRLDTRGAHVLHHQDAQGQVSAPAAPKEK